MKFSRVFYSILIIGIAIIGGVLLYQVYSEEIDQQETLEQNLATSESAVPTLVNEIGNLQQEVNDLETELVAARAELSEVESKFLETVSSITYGDILFFEAQVLDLDIVDFSATEPYATNINGITYEAIDITVVIYGNVPSVLSYLTIIELA